MTMKSTAFVSGASHGLGFALTSFLLSHDWQVFAGRYPNDWSELEVLQNQFSYTLFPVSLGIASTDSVRAAA